MDIPVVVPRTARKNVTVARKTSKAVVTAGGVAVDSAAKLVGVVAGQMTPAFSAAVRKVGIKPNSGWVKDVKYVGKSSVGAAFTVYEALIEAADQITQVTLGSSADLIGHKFGEEAGDTTREGFRCVGNLMAAKSLMSRKNVARTMGVKCTMAAAASAKGALRTSKDAS